MAGTSAAVNNEQTAAIGAKTLGGFPSGQRGQTVNLMALPSQVRILHPPLMFVVCKPVRSLLGGGLAAVRGASLRLVARRHAKRS